jgi:Mn-dependent DtxR family transcriptional regulator
MVMLESGEMYLETIYILSQKSSTVRGVDVGEYMGFRSLRSAVPSAS